MAMPRGTKARLREYAQFRAAGNNPVEASKLAGYPPGSGFASNAYKRDRRDDVKAWIGEFRKPIAEKLQITQQFLLEEAVGLYSDARIAGQYNAAVTALKEVGVLSGLRTERREHALAGMFDVIERMSVDELNGFIAGDLTITDSGQVVPAIGQGTGETGEEVS
jgi:hypothetical protein